MKDENCFMMVLICMKTMKMESIYLTKKNKTMFSSLPILQLCMMYLNIHYHCLINTISNYFNCIS